MPELREAGLDAGAVDAVVHPFDAVVDALTEEPFSRKVILEQAA